LLSTAAFRQTFFGDAEDLRNALERWRCFRQRLWLRILGAILEHAEGKRLFHDIAHPVLRFDRLHLPNSRAGREDLNHGEAEAAHLVFNGAANGARGLRNLLVVAEADALNVDGRFKCGEQFTHVQRVAFIGCVAAVG